MSSIKKMFMVVLYTVLALNLHAKGQILNSEAWMVIPEAENGLAEIPLLNGYNPDRLVSQKNVKCQAQYDSSGITFIFSFPCLSDSKPQGCTLRDDSRIWSESQKRAEVFLQLAPKGSFYHYIVNTAGGVFDEKNGDQTWNGHAKVEITFRSKTGQIRITIPFSDIGFDPVKNHTLRGNVVFESRDSKDKCCLTWAAVGMTFVNPESFGEWRLSKNSPFVTEFNVSPVNCSKNGVYLFTNYAIKNPTAENVNITTGQRNIDIPANGIKTFTEKITLDTSEKEPLVVFNIKDIFNYRHRVANPLFVKIQFVALDWDTAMIKVRNINTIRQYADKAVLKKDGKTIFQGSLTDLEKIKLNIGSWPKGDHVLQFSFLNSANKPVLVHDEKVYTFKPQKYDYDITKLDASKYYQPIELKNNRLMAARSEFDLSKGVLPEQISVNGVLILAAPVTIKFDGKPVRLKPELDVLQDNKNQFKIRSSGKSGKTSVTVNADYEYDGFTWYDVTIQGDSPLEYGPLDIEIPLKLGKDILVGQTGAISNRQILHDKISGVGYVKEAMGNWSVMKTDTLDYPMVNCVSLATDSDEQYRGLCFIIGGVQGWNLKSYDKMYHIKKGENGKVTMTVRISDGVTRWKRDKIQFSFGIEPFPMRKYPNDFHGYYRLDTYFYPNNFKERYEKDPKPILDLFKRIQNVGVDTFIAFEHWTEYENYWKAGDKREEDMQAYVKAVHDDAKMKMIFYFGFLLSNKVPEYKLYHELILMKTDNKLHNPDKVGFQPYIFYKFGNPNQNCFPDCTKGLWGEYWLAGVKDAISRYDMDGIYLDGTLVSKYCMNTKHGCGTIDAYGRLVPTYPVRETRRKEEILYTIGQQKDKDFVIDLHMPSPCAPFMALISAFWTGEANHLWDLKYARMSPDMLRGWLNGRLFGVPCDLLLRPPYHFDVGWGQCLLVDAYIRSCFGGGMRWNEITKRMWDLYEKYGMTADTFTPFFSTNNKIIKDNPNVYVSYYDTPKALILVVSNYMQEKKEKVTLNLSRFGLGNISECRDVWRDKEKFEIKDGKITLNIPKLSLRLIVIKK